ncbi:MAG: twin-arginine translocation signal domain-containing protein, partial [Cytophagaceae bacterium]
MRLVSPEIIHERCNTPSRRSFLKYASGIAAALSPALAQAQGQAPASSDKVDFPPDHADTEATEKMPEASLPPSERVGYAVVGLGRLTMARLLPALAKCKYSRLVALVSGDRAKAQKLARQYGLGDLQLPGLRTHSRQPGRAGGLHRPA